MLYKNMTGLYKYEAEKAMLARLNRDIDIYNSENDAHLAHYRKNSVFLKQVLEDYQFFFWKGNGYLKVEIVAFGDEPDYERYTHDGYTLMD